MADVPDPGGEDLPDEPGDGPVDPFAALPLFGDLAKALAGQGPLNWDAARQFAHLGSTGGTPEANVDPAVRVTYAELASIARLHVADVMGTDVADIAPETVSRGAWAAATLDAYRHLFTSLASALGAPADDPEAGADPMGQMMAGLAKMMAPAMLGMSVGSMVGSLATRAFGTHDLPIPRQPDRLLMIPANVDGFAGEWEIPLDEMRLWVIAHELAGHTLFSVPHVRDAVADLVREHVGGFRPDPTAVAQHLGDLDDGSGDPMAALQQALGDPTVLLGAVTSPEQRSLQPRLDSLVAVVVGYVDWVVDAVAVRLVGGGALRIAEAVRRRRVSTASDERFVEQLLGIRIGDDQVGRGKAFVQGVVDRTGDRGLLPLLERPDAIPTPNEVDAPGLWLARLDG